MAWLHFNVLAFRNSIQQISQPRAVVVLFLQGFQHELGCGGVERWTSRESPPEDPGDGKSAGQAKERKDTETVSVGLLRSCPPETEAKGHIFCVDLDF